MVTFVFLPVVKRAAVDIDKYRPLVERVEIGPPVQSAERRDVTPDRGGDGAFQLGRCGFGLRQCGCGQRGPRRSEKETARQICGLQLGHDTLQNGQEDNTDIVLERRSRKSNRRQWCKEGLAGLKGMAFEATNSKTTGGSAMMRNLLLLIGVLAVAACGGPPRAPTLGPDGQPLPQVYRISSAMESRIQFRVLDSVNALRQASGASPVSLNAQLNAAAATHARDMSVQNRPWHFGSDGSSPIERVQRAGYTGRLVGELISETFETETQTLAAWMEEEGTRRIILSPDASDMGFEFYQEANGKIWWTLIMGGAGSVLETAPRPDAQVERAERLVNATAATALE